MTGAFLKEWADKKGKRPEHLAADLGVSIGTLYIWFRSAQLDKRTQLALAQIGCSQPTVAQKRNSASAQ